MELGCDDGQPADRFSAQTAASRRAALSRLNDLAGAEAPWSLNSVAADAARVAAQAALDASHVAAAAAEEREAAAARRETAAQRRCLAVERRCAALECALVAADSMAADALAAVSLSQQRWMRDGRRADEHSELEDDAAVLEARLTAAAEAEAVLLADVRQLTAALTAERARAEEAVADGATARLLEAEQRRSAALTAALRGAEERAEADINYRATAAACQAGLMKQLTESRTRELEIAAAARAESAQLADSLKKAQRELSERMKLDAAALRELAATSAGCIAAALALQGTQQSRQDSD